MFIGAKGGAWFSTARKLALQPIPPVPTKMAHPVPYARLWSISQYVSAQLSFKCCILPLPQPFPLAPPSIYPPPFVCRAVYLMFSCVTSAVLFNYAP